MSRQRVLGALLAAGLVLDGCGSSHPAPPEEVVNRSAESGPQVPPPALGRRLQAVAPGNDDIAGARVIGALPFAETVDVAGATSEADEPPPCGYFPERSIWYVYTPTTTGKLVASAAGSTSTTELAVYTGAAGALVPRSCIDPITTGANPTLALDVTAGETLYFQVSSTGFLPEVALASFRLGEPAPAPANDDFDAAVPITALPFRSTIDDFVNVTAAPDDPNSCNGSQDPTVWYAYTNSTAAPVRIAFGTGFVGLFNIDVYTGARGSLDKLVCNTPYYPARGFNVAIRPGEAIQAAMSSTNNEVGPGTFTAALAPPGPDNDELEGALPLTLDGPGVGADLTNAAVSLDDPALCSASIRTPRTAWWTYLPDQDVEVEAVVPNGESLGVFRGRRGALSQLGCGGGIARFRARAGERVYVMVGSITAEAVQVRVRTFVPLQAAVTVDPVATLDRRTNQVTVRGTLTANKEANFNYCARLDQRAGKLLIGSQSPCDARDGVAGAVPWTMTFAGQNGTFVPGPASVRFDGGAGVAGTSESQALGFTLPLRIKAAR